MAAEAPNGTIAGTSTDGGGLGMADTITSSDVKRQAPSAAALVYLKSGKSFMRTVTHRGHRNLGIRGCVAFLQAVLTLVMVLVVGPENYPMGIPMCCCQLWASTTLMIQCRTGNPWMFVLRSIPSFLRCIFTIFMASCGRQVPFAEFCNTQAWHDQRLPFRVMHCFAAVRFFMNGCSLLLQFTFPWAGVGVYGNQQLFYRGCIQASGIPLQLFRGMLKMGELTGTPYERLPVEVIVNFLRCFVLIPIASWSLLDQWTSTGKGQKTDDARTTKAQGQVIGNAAESLGHKLSPHKGHRNLLIRGAVAFCQGTMTLFMIAYDIDIPHKIPTAVCQFIASTTLLVQWRTGNPKMFVCRAVPSFMRAAVLAHMMVCGRRWPGEECVDEAWGDERMPFRVLHIFATVRMFLNGCSLMCQYKFFHRTFLGHGNEQLFYRGCIQSTGVPLHLIRAVLKLTLMRGSEFERSSLEVAVNFIRGLVLIPIASWSLFNQWWNTGTGNMGHARLNKHENLKRMESMEPTSSFSLARTLSSLQTSAVDGAPPPPVTKSSLASLPEDEEATEEGAERDPSRPPDCPEDNEGPSAPRGDEAPCDDRLDLVIAEPMPPAAFVGQRRPEADDSSLARV